MSAPVATQWNQLVSLDQMRNTMRRMTARYTEQQLPTTQVDYYLNLAYTLHFPLQFKNLKLTRPLVFNTIPNVDTYTFTYEQGVLPSPIPATPTLYNPGGIQVTPPAYCQGYLLRYYQDKSLFFNLWPDLSVNQIINSGTGISGQTYAGFIPTSMPFYRAQMDIFGNVTKPAVVISAYDTTGFNYAITDVPQPNSNTGNLIDNQDNVVGTVNYITGQYSFTPANSAIIPVGDTIYASVVPYQSSRPVDVLFYNQQFVFRPCPMQVYQVEFQISMQPTQLIAANQAPELDEWYLCLCCIAAKLIYTDFPDPEGMAQLMPIYQDQIQMAQRRTLRQLSSQRAQTLFSTPGWSRNWGNYYFGSDYSGS